MKSRMFWTFALASCLIACGKQPPADEAPVETAAEEPVAAAEPAPVEPAPAEPAAVETEAAKPVFGQEFLDHMHAHAERVDEIMYALDDGDLDTAKAAAYWLAKHKTVDGIPDEWQRFVVSMREAASRVEGAVDIESARMAAEAISPQCQGCHSAAGILVQE
ncbi:MAG: hypothetical protein QNJ23_08825 [Woeseiaceae bacterium]|nr:hypothetical protein [Woeseiaceae bacterium]